MSKIKSKNLLIFKRLWRHISPNRKINLILLLILTIIVSIAEVVSIGAVIPFLSVIVAPERVFNHPEAQTIIYLLKIKSPEEMLKPLALLFGFLAILAGTLRLILLGLQMRVSYSMGADFGVLIFERTLHQPYKVHLGRNTSEIIAGITSKTNQLVYAAIYPALSLVAALFLLLMILSVLIIIDPYAAIGSFFGFGLIYLMVVIITKKRISRYGEDINTSQNKVIKILQEGLGGIRDVLVDDNQDIYVNIYKKSEILMRRSQANVQILTTCPRFVIEALGMALIAAVAYQLTTNQNEMGNAIPVLGALALGAQRLMPVMQQAYTAWISMKSGQASVEDAINLLDQPLNKESKDNFDRIKYNKKINVINAEFRYEDTGTNVINNITFEIKKGERIGIVGKSGSGKTTLLDIVMGLLYLNKGNISIDDIEITSKNNRGLRALIAHVPQTVYLADATISENIAFGVQTDKINHQQVEVAATKAQLAKTISCLENKYQTNVGERGVRLSGGQRQRIGIARALYKKAEIIIFDEATSALDTETENAVMESISSLDDNLTIIMVAHRISTLKNCTKIFKIDEGKISDLGSYKDALNLI